MTTINLTNGEGICYGLFSCMAPEGLFNGVSREEKLALRQAERAEHAFRLSKGYEKDTALERLKRRLGI